MNASSFAQHLWDDGRMGIGHGVGGAGRGAGVCFTAVRRRPLKATQDRVVHSNLNDLLDLQFPLHFIQIHRRGQSLS